MRWREKKNIQVADWNEIIYVEMNSKIYKEKKTQIIRSHLPGKQKTFTKQKQADALLIKTVYGKQCIWKYPANKITLIVFVWQMDIRGQNSI